MPRLLLLPALVLAGCGGQTSVTEANAAASPAKPALAALTARAVSIDEKTDLLDFHLGWPAEVSAIPALEKMIREPALAHKAELLKTAASDKAERAKSDFPFNAYEFSEQYDVEGESSRILSLSDNIMEFTGGAHPNHGTKAVIWDREAGKMIAFADLLTGGAGALDDLFKKDFCAALDKARAEKRGPEDAANPNPTPPGDPFNQCPKWDELALMPKGEAGKPLSTIVIHADPYVAGPYAEGDYDIELPVTAAVIAALKPEYRASFAPR